MKIMMKITPTTTYSYQKSIRTYVVSMFGKMTNKEKKEMKEKSIDKLFNPDTNGLSEWKTKTEILEVECLRWGGNGLGRSSVYWRDFRYVWEKQADSVMTLRTIGFNSECKNRYISHEIHAFHKSEGNLCVSCGSGSNLVTDHKNDLYNDPKVLSKDTQTIDDFQCLCTSCNLKKREVSKQTKFTNKRYGATKIPQLQTFGTDFISGDETFDMDDVNAMVGTYWYDPIEFMQFIKNSIVKENEYQTLQIIKENNKLKLQNDKLKLQNDKLTNRLKYL